MSKKIYVEGIDELPLPLRRVELVERKGIGHPDSVADALAEEVSRALCRMYKKEFGHVLHHNTDEAQIVAGASQPRFGGGHIINPAYILLVGRSTSKVKERDGYRELPCNTLALKAAKDYLRAQFNNLDVDNELIMDIKMGQGSSDLMGVFETSKLLANDTSFGVSYAPFSQTESAVMEAERFINGPLKDTMPEAGHDVKVMASRVDDRLSLTVACAMVDKHIDDADHYRSVVDELRSRTHDHLLKFTDLDLAVDVNTADDYARENYYLTCTGLSQEMGDDGSVGRGNRANGLITPYRPMSMEATSGKNPITHIGKIYNILARIIAEDIAKEVPDEAEVRVRLLSQIGSPISEPHNANIQIITRDQGVMERHSKEAEQITQDWLQNIDRVTEMIIDGKLSTF